MDFTSVSVFPVPFSTGFAATSPPEINLYASNQPSAPPPSVPWACHKAPSLARSCSLYISPIAHIVAAHGLMQQQYADDTELYVAISHLNRDTALAQLERCLDELHTWFCCNGLSLNPTKQMQYYTELPCVPKRFQSSTSLTSPERLLRCPTASRSLALYLIKISPSTLTFLTFPNHVAITFRRTATYDQHSQTMSPKWSHAPLSAVALNMPTRYSSAPRRKT